MQHLPTDSQTSNEILPGLPETIATYLAAEKAKDVDMLSLCFAETARVFDEDHDYRGIDAIKSWQREAEAKYQYVVEPLEATVEPQEAPQSEQIVKLHVRVRGNFPGSPAELNYKFTIADDKITALEIQ